MNSSSLTCALCTRPIISTSNVRSCSSCRKFTHSDCDCDSLSANTVETEYVCPTCRNSPLVADAMMISAGNSSVAASPTSISTHDETSRSIPLDNPYCIDSPSNRNSPLMSLSQLDTFGDFFNIHQSTGQVPSMSPSGSTALSGPMSSCRASPGSFPEFSNTGDATDELRFSSRKERNDTSCNFSRTSRGGGVKKPYSRGITPRTRSLGGASDFTEVTHSHRGKRGGRGGNKNGRGRRPRGGKTSAMLAMVNAAAANRDADQESSEMDDTRHRMEENDYIRTVVVTCAENSYFLQMPLCLICGSIGKDVERTMVTCATCSQSYHTYCVGLHDKLNSTIVRRGWRCLDCTVCEGCGDGHDESNLILCDECDISYHIYCLEPPLERIPQGPWRCKWCSACQRCGKQIFNFVDNKRFCEACFTLRRCPKCLRFYEIGENIIKCQHCARWLHGKCEELYSDEMFETASENGFRCSLCRPQGNLASDAFNVLICDNVTMNKCALEVLHLRCGGALFRYPSSTDSIYDFPSYFFAPRSHSFEEPVEEDDVENSGFGMSVGMSGRGRGMRSGGPGRRVMKLGVGGFFVKVPRHRLSNAEDENGVEEDSAKPKIKRFRKPRRSQLEDNYPPVIQESFFGMRPVEGRCLLDVVVDEPNLMEHQRATLILDKQKEASELNEMDSEALRESESLLGNITENDILGNMEEIDFDNLDLNELLLDGDEDDDDDETLENTLSDKMGPCSEDGQITASPHSGPIRSQTFCSGQQARRFTIASASNLTQGGIRQNVHVPGYNQAGIYAQPRSSSQMGDICTERVNQATEKWEEDEPLGERATKAAVLYANINYPQWKEQYPEWPERVKHIHRMWRSLDANSRQQYVNKARENRANRVKQPRAKRITTSSSTPTGVVRAIVGPNRYGLLSGQESMAGYCRSEVEYNERFKVPTIPFGGGECVMGQNASVNSVDISMVQSYGASQQHYYHSEQESGSFTSASQPRPSPVRNPQSLIAHLSKEVLDNYSLLQKRSNELAKYQLAIENDLARMRKQKKNLTAKRRQLNKNNQQYDAHGQRIEIELSETDRHSLTTLANAIPIRQKDLENCKRDIKLHSSNVRDFEVKNNIPPELIPQMTPVVQPVGLHVNAARTKQLQSSTPPTPSDMISPNSAIRPPPSYPAFGMMANYRPPYQPGVNQMSEYNHSGYSTTPKSETETAQMSLDSPTPSSGRPGSSSSTEWQYRSGRGKRKKRDDDRSEESKRPTMLGDVAAENLATQFERDIYDVVDRLITQAVIMVDGAEAARKSGMLKKLLESQLKKDYPSQRNSFSGLEFNIPPKPKKKRTQQKKLGVGNNNEYELLLERISTQLRLCPQLPRSAIEPISRIGRSSYAMFGVTDLPDRIDKPSIKGSEIGDIRLVFMGDYYMRLFQCPFDENSFYQTMSDFAADIKLPVLYRTRCVIPRGIQEREKPVSKMRALSVVRRSGSPPLRQISRIPESVVPEAPPRHAFFKKRESPKKVEVSIVFEGPEGSLDAEAGLRQLMVLLGMEQLPDYEFDTPPQTPEPSKRDLGEIQKTESPVTDDFTCRHCGALTDQPAVRQTACQLGIVDHEPKDETLAFCSMNCYYNYMANAKASLSPEDLSRAERFIGAETLAKLRQASADNFAKYLHLGKFKGQLESPGNSNVCSPLSDGRTELDARNNIQVLVFDTKLLSVKFETSMGNTSN
ncbi:Histone-lysine N-methyltransferase 2C [Dirofilaria immitis]